MKRKESKTAAGTGGASLCAPRYRCAVLILILLGIICLVYGFLVLGTASGTAFFAVWFGIAALLFLAAALTGLHVWASVPRAVRTAGLVLFCALLICFAVIEGMILSGFSGKTEADLDCIIVLGAQVKENGPSTVLRYRLDRALEYLNENPDTICIVSGGQGPNEPFPEAEGMKRYLTENGVDPGRIRMEDRSLDTRQNIEFSKKLLDPERDRIGIVTNDFHVFRGCALAKKAGLSNVCGIPAHSARLYLPNNMLREFFAMMKDLLAGNLAF